MNETHLVLEGVSEEELTIEFLVAVMDVADEQGLALRGISICFDSASEE